MIQHTSFVRPEFLFEEEPVIHMINFQIEETQKLISSKPLTDEELKETTEKWRKKVAENSDNPRRQAELQIKVNNCIRLQNLRSMLGDGAFTIYNRPLYEAHKANFSGSH